MPAFPLHSLLKPSNTMERSNLYALILLRTKSQSTSISKKRQRVRDHGFDTYMDDEKKTRKALKLQSLILSRPKQTLPVSRLDALSRPLGFKQHEPGAFLLKFPHVFDVYEHPVHRVYYCRLTQKALHQIAQEKEALIGQLPEAVTRLRKLLMMSNSGRIRVEHVRVARSEFGLPDDFVDSVVLKNPDWFRLVDDNETRSKYIEVVDRDPEMRVCAIENVREVEYREKGMDAEDVRFAFAVKFPPGFKIGKYYKIAVWRWQRTPYWSPYEDIKGYDMRSDEAQRRFEKRAVAVVHEVLSLTVEKRLTLERIANFREVFDLPKKLKEFLLQHQGIFYISTRGNQGKLNKVFLREAYRRGELVEPNKLYLARRKLDELVLMKSKGSSMDRELVGEWRKGRDNRVVSFRREFVANGLECGEDGQCRQVGDDSSMGLINDTIRGECPGNGLDSYKEGRDMHVHDDMDSDISDELDCDSADERNDYDNIINLEESCLTE